MKALKIIILITIAISLLSVCSSRNTDEDDINKDIWVIQDNDKISIGYRYNEEEDIWIQFAKRGINELMQISNISTSPIQDNMTIYTFNKLVKVELMDSCTDWIGPYMVRKGLKKSTYKPRFTGGWHSVDDKDGTAKMIDYSVIIDGDVNNNNIKKASNVTITVKNNIQGYNTLESKEEILQETVIYNINSKDIQVEVSIKALDDIVIERYYGLQTQNSLYKGIRYEGSDDTKFDSYETSNSPPKNDNYINKFTLDSEDGMHILEAYLNNEYGLGIGEYVDESLPYAFTLSYGKSYFNIVNGKELFIKKGETAGWKGKYILRYNNDIN
ncbi:hypothetical protein [Vallitalea sp.]|jgi:hypothetical protein|uniref:hypothetical protein n=1 Tax=Vallitalea sp. TaxID=1882829 RepID=UPI0025DD0258|nr:hypothetical protein [Vallitalea sp.]MCT4688600.1 hypothetical protein [Vallitalea sp.]